jgi:OHCU decarboxylase
MQNEMTFSELNTVSESLAVAELSKCCGSSSWLNKMLKYRPFKNENHLFEMARKIWFEECQQNDWKEAFTHHPKIGNVKELEEKFASTKDWPSNEQAGVNNASKQILQDLADLNQQYENKFGYIFIVCASGKSAEEMLGILKNRMTNTSEAEIKTAMNEQNKITKIRLGKLLNS